MLKIVTTKVKKVEGRTTCREYHIIHEGPNDFKCQRQFALETIKEFGNSITSQFYKYLDNLLETVFTFSAFQSKPFVHCLWRTFQSITGLFEMFLSKRLYILVLCIAFFYAVLKSYLNVLMEPSTFQERVVSMYGTLPSLTYCPNILEKDTFKTIEDISEAISNNEKDRIAFLKYFASNIEHNVNIDITNSSVLQDYNTSLNYVWQSGVMVDFRSPHPITLCTTLNLGKNRLKGLK